MSEINEQSDFIPQVDITASLGTCWPKSCSVADLSTTMDTGMMTSIDPVYAANFYRLNF